MSELRGAFRTLRVTPVVTLIAVLSLALGIAAVGALAGWLPARRAARLDPSLVLREE